MSLPVSIDKMYTMYFDTFVKLGQSYFPNSDMVYDLAQETLIKVWLNKDKYNSEHSLYTWLKRIFTNTAIDYKRSIKGQGKTKRAYLRDTDDVFQNFRCSGLNIDTVDIENNLNKLEYKYKLILHLLFLQEYTQEEISEEFNIPLGTVKSRKRIALRELRKIYC